MTVTLRPAGVLLLSLATAAGCARQHTTCPAPTDAPGTPPAGAALMHTGGAWQVVPLIPPQGVPAAPPAGGGR